MKPSDPHYPSMFGIHVWDSLFQNSNPFVPNDISYAEIDKRMRKRYERGLYIEYLSHRGPCGAYGVTLFIDNLPGM